MKRALFYLATVLASSISFATPIASSPSSTAFAKTLGNAFKNHTVIPRNATQQTLATTYGGDDIANKALPALRAIA